MPVNLFDAFSTDIESEEIGKWFEDVLNDESGLGFKVRRLTAKSVDKTRNKLMTASRKYVVKGKLPPDKDEQLLCELLAQAVVVDWKGVANPEKPDEEWSFSVERATYLFTKLPNLRRVILSISGDMANFKAETLEEVEGN